MRIIGFEKDDWQSYYRNGGSCDKMSRPEFTTFRWPRRDNKDYQMGELLQVVIKPRSEARKPLGIVAVVGREELDPYWKEGGITDEMARQDGFFYATELVTYLYKKRDYRNYPPKVYRYTLIWIYRLPKYHEEHFSFIEHGDLVITKRSVLKNGEKDVVARIRFIDYHDNPKMMQCGPEVKP
jgi:hypothetical protein